LGGSPYVHLHTQSKEREKIFMEISLVQIDLPKNSSLRYIELNPVRAKVNNLKIGPWRSTY